MPLYDPATDEIVNCQENTLFWHHENRHKWQAHSNILREIRGYVEWVIIGVILFILVNDLFWARVLFFIFILYFLFIETDAWIYAFMKILEKKALR